MLKMARHMDYNPYCRKINQFEAFEKGDLRFLLGSREANLAEGDGADGVAELWFQYDPAEALVVVEYCFYLYSPSVASCV